MSCSDIISIVCSALSLIAAVVIGVWQIIQNRRVNKLTVEQSVVEKRRYEESVEIEARRFLVEYHDVIGLLPLCAIAVVYDKNRPYSRKMYSDFRMLSKDVRLRIFERCGWIMCDVESDDFFSECLSRLRIAVDRFLPKDDFFHMFYEQGKYVKRALTGYACKCLPHEDFIFDDDFFDIIATPFRGLPYDYAVIDEIMARFAFRESDEILRCQIACSVAKYIAVCAGDCVSDGDEDENGPDYGSPGSYDRESIETMEDLFLVTLFTIWLNLWDIEEGLSV